MYSTWLDKFIAYIRNAYIALLIVSILKSHSTLLCVLQTQRFLAVVTLYFTIAPSTRTRESLSRDDELAALITLVCCYHKISKPAYISLIIHGTILTRAQS